jgi:hypothetical protein
MGQCHYFIIFAPKKIDTNFGLFDSKRLLDYAKMNHNLYLEENRQNFRRKIGENRRKY